MSLLLGTLMLLSQSASPDTLTPRVTFYDLRGTMADGNQVYLGAAACSMWIPFGTQLEFSDGWVVTCEDHGKGDLYWRQWVDVWAPSYQWGRENVVLAYGDYTTVIVDRWGWYDSTN